MRFMFNSYIHFTLFMIYIVKTSTENQTCPKGHTPVNLANERFEFDCKSSLDFVSTIPDTSLFSPICYDVNLHIQMLCGEYGTEHISSARNILKSLVPTFDDTSNTFHMANNVYHPDIITETYAGWNPLFLIERYNTKDSLSVFSKHKMWLNEKSENHISTPLSEANFVNMERIYCSVVYFNDAWAKRFDSQNTKEDTFKIRTGEEISRPFLNNTGYYMADVCEANGCKFKVVAIPYEEEMGKFQYKRYIIYLIPSEHDVQSKDLWAAYCSICNGRIIGHLVRLKSEKICLSIPKIEVLKSELNLSCIFVEPVGKNNLREVKTIMKTYIQIDEQETEAIGALTSSLTCAPQSSPIYIKADKPYIALIYDLSINRILFIFKDEGTR